MPLFRRRATAIASFLLGFAGTALAMSLLADPAVVTHQPTEPWALIAGVFVLLQGGLGTLLLWGARRLIREEVASAMAAHETDPHVHRAAVAVQAAVRDGQTARIEGKIDRLAEMLQANREEWKEQLAENREERQGQIQTLHDSLQALLAEHRALAVCAPAAARRRATDAPGEDYSRARGRS